jgi:hypothetical protein
MNSKILGKNAKGDFPDGPDAERWLDPDRFVYKGEVYRINPDFTISKVNHAV